MRKIFFLPAVSALLLACFCLVFAALPEPVDYLDYHRAYAGVEALIVAEDFASAETQLDRLLEEYDVRFAKDLVVAAQLGLLNQHPDKALRYLNQALEKGVKSDVLFHIPLLHTRLSPADWQQLREQEPAARKRYFSRIDTALFREFHRRFQDEQDAKGTERYRDIVSANYRRIKALLEKGRFPGEALIGLDDHRYAPSASDGSLSNAKVIATLQHYDYPLGETGEAPWLDAIRQGLLHPREYAVVYNFEKSKVSVLYRHSGKSWPVLPERWFNFPFAPQSEQLDRVNADRDAIGICSFETERRKDPVEKKYGIRLDFNY
ncbi:MAG TPA: hypothetical protein PLW66_15135 [Saprospiraceae bacterium]|nr:hypothetical protein [Saprospiraceae bacterium]